MAALISVGLVGSAAGQEYAFVETRDGRFTINGAPFQFAGLNVWNANENPRLQRYCGTPPDLSAAGSEFGPGIRTVRIWFFQRLATTPAGERDWTTFDQTLRDAALNNLRVIAVLGNQWADCEGYDSAEAGFKTQQWYRDGYRQQRPPGQPATYRDWTREVVDRYKNDPTIMLWQLVNEPEDPVSYGGYCPWDAAVVLRDFTRDVGQQIKDIDSRHLVGMGTVGSGQCGTSNEEYVRLNAESVIDVADYHDYSLDVVPGDQWNGLAARAAQMVALRKPLIIGEVGVVPNQVGGIEQRAALIGSKVRADFQLGVRGALVWAWRPAVQGGTNPDGYDVGPGDPTLDQLAALTSSAAAPETAAPETAAPETAAPETATSGQPPNPVRSTAPNGSVSPAVPASAGERAAAQAESANEPTDPAEPSRTPPDLGYAGEHPGAAGRDSW